MESCYIIQADLQHKAQGALLPKLPKKLGLEVWTMMTECTCVWICVHVRVSVCVCMCMFLVLDPKPWKGWASVHHCPFFTHFL